MLKFSPKQQEYIRNSNHRWNFKTGAVRSGKSYVDTAFVIPDRIRERIGKPGLTVILGVSRDTIERNVLQPMREIYTSNLVSEINSRNIATIRGEKVYCLGAEKISQVSKIQGSSIKYAYGDEVAKWNKEVFEMLKSRLDKPYSCFDGACNPENPTHWLKSFLDDGNIDIYIQKYRIFDNPFLPEEYVENLCREYFGTVYYDRLIEGKWKRAEGSIYRRFADEPESFIKPVDIQNIQKIVCGIDFGGNGSGHSFVATAFYRDGRRQPVMSCRHLNKDFAKGIDPIILSKLFIEFLDAVVQKYGTPSHVYYDNAETVLGNGIKKAVAEKYPKIQVKGAKKIRINDRIEYTLRLMGSGLFSISEDCTTLKKALQDAVYDEKSTATQRLDDGSTDIDTLDAFEYTIERDISDAKLHKVRGSI